MKVVFYLMLFIVSNSLWARWSVATYNMRNFDRGSENGRTNIGELSRIIQDFKSDVMTFVEVVNLNAFKNLMQETLPEYKIIVSSCGGAGKQKLAVAYNPSLFNFISMNEDTSFSGPKGCGSLRPALLVTLEDRLHSEKYTFITLHLKAGSSIEAMNLRWKQYTLLTNLAKSYQEKNQHLILLGDFNTTGYNQKNEDYAHFENFLHSSLLYSTSEKLGCTSYWKGPVDQQRHQSSILDHIILDRELQSKRHNVRTGLHCAKMSCQDAWPEELGTSYLEVSDHCPIQVTFN